jgi:hypothetical protein
LDWSKPSNPVPHANPIFAPPAKRLAASAIDAAIVTCLGWFIVNVITREWYPYEYLAWGLPLTYWVYESYCLTRLDGASLTIADIVAHTRVVNTPPPQPHRAPAGPMYSATDAEFGYQPRRRK